MPKISIIVPVYKSEKYLSECVESILNQSFRDLEIILVDDGSPDDSPAICDKYAESDERVRVVHKENRGVSTARNAGLEIATGDYVTFVDSDDFIEPNMYERMAFVASENNCDVVLCDCVKDFGDRSEVYSHDIRSGFYDRKQLEEEYFPHLLMMENVEYPATISNCLLLFRRNLANDVRYLEGVRYSEDLLFGAQLLYRANSFFYMKNEAYYHYRMNPDSATHKFVSDKWNDYVKLHQGIIDAFASCRDFDFRGQIDLCLLFFLYNSLNDILGTSQMSYSDKKCKINSILKENKIREMFCRIRISKLSISYKQRIITWLYKKRLAIGLLCRYYTKR